jgi:NodT family efflux transporter outer membrane factor (OMF) lipoprotein
MLRRLPGSGGLFSTLACVLTAGCVVGPNFTPPAPPQVSGYAAAPLAATASSPGVTAGEAQRFTTDADIPGDWWTLFHSQPLNELIQQALINNPDLKAAQAALSAAHETTLAQRGAFYPTITAGFSGVRQRQSAALSPTPSNNALVYNLFTPQVSVTYAPDIFGLNRRGAESAQAEEQAVRYQMAAAHLALTSNLVAAAIQAASLQAQIDATRQLIDADGKIVELLRLQMAKGYASGLDLATEQSQLAQAVATLPPLLKQEAQQRDLLAVLAGRYPRQAPTDRFDLASLTLPQDLPLSLPSSLVAQRPDVLQAQANLHVASANIGVATANRLPSFALTADGGGMALAFGQIFGAGMGFWDLGAAVTAPIFDGGTLLHQQRAAKDLYVQAAEQYRSTVLTAFQNVADTLIALQQDADALKAAVSAADAAKTTLDLSQRQVQAGYASDLALLAAQQAYQQTQISLVQAQANRFADTAALYQALGGGWWRRGELTGDKHGT